MKNGVGTRRPRQIFGAQNFYICSQTVDTTVNPFYQYFFTLGVILSSQSARIYGENILVETNLAKRHKKEFVVGRKVFRQKYTDSR